MATNNDAACDDPLSLVCKLCDKPYQHKDGPLLLPCLHSFCKPCLTEYVKKAPATDNKMACPTCNNRFPQDISQLPINLRLSHLAKTVTYEKQAEGRNVKCEACDESPKDATTFCCNCCEFYCAKCKKDHQKFLKHEEHELIDIAKFEKGEFKVHSPPPKCPLHKEKQIIFCDDCGTLICLYCAQTKHQEHKKSSIDDVAATKKQQLHQLTDGVDVALGAMDGFLQQIQDTRDKVKTSAEVAANRIDKMCDELVKAVENRRKVLKGKCREIAEGKDDILSNQMFQVQRLRRNLGFAHLHTLDAINSHAPEEILSVKKPIEARLNRTFETYKRESMELREDDSINTSTEIVDLEEAIGKVGSFPSVPDPSQCCVNGLGAIPVAIIGREKKMTVVLKDDAGNPIPNKYPFQYQLRKVGEDPYEYIPPRVTITHSNNGTATLAFTPDQPGEYELTIMVRNRPIANPFEITGIHDPKGYSNFQNMQVTYKNVGGACDGVAVHDNGTVYASDDSAHTIKVFKPNGEETQIGSSDNAGGNLSRPTGIALIGDTIYVASYGNYTVKMYSADGRFIGGFGGKGNGTGQLSKPLGICTDGKGRVLVADQSNKRIQIFTSQGVFIKSIGCSNLPKDVAVDPEGNIHAALLRNNHIAIYSEDGNLIDTYNLGGRLQGPQAIYIDGEGNRLIGTDNGPVYIADPTGTLIATRQVGMSFAVTMDKNGIIYVAENSNKRVSIYN